MIGQTHWWRLKLPREVSEILKYRERQYVASRPAQLSMEGAREQILFAARLLKDEMERIIEELEEAPSP